MSQVQFTARRLRFTGPTGRFPAPIGRFALSSAYRGSHLASAAAAGGFRPFIHRFTSGFRTVFDRLLP
jgi:hypothetical protein